MHYTGRLCRPVALYNISGKLGDGENYNVSDIMFIVPHYNRNAFIEHIPT